MIKPNIIRTNPLRTTILKTMVIGTLSLGLLAITSQSVYASDLMTQVHDLQVGWAKANYQLEDDAQTDAFEALIKQGQTATQQYADAAESWIWLGIIQSTYAGKAGPFSALGYAKDAKASLEKAIAINPEALHGSAYTSLGTLYFKVPGWPLGFGDDDEAEKLLKKAMDINPDGIDSNYFYADFLTDQDHYSQAKKHLLKAQDAAARPTRPVADKGRHQEIKNLLAKVAEELEYEASQESDD